MHDLRAAAQERRRQERRQGCGSYRSSIETPVYAHAKPFLAPRGAGNACAQHLRLHASFSEEASQQIHVAFDPAAHGWIALVNVNDTHGGRHPVRIVIQGYVCRVTRQPGELEHEDKPVEIAAGAR